MSKESLRLRHRPLTVDDADAFANGPVCAPRDSRPGLSQVPVSHPLVTDRMSAKGAGGARSSWFRSFHRILSESARRGNTRATRGERRPGSSVPPVQWTVRTDAHPFGEQRQAQGTVLTQWSAVGSRQRPPLCEAALFAASDAARMRDESYLHTAAAYLGCSYWTLRDSCSAARFPPSAFRVLAHTMAVQCDGS